MALDEFIVLNGPGANDAGTITPTKSVAVAPASLVSILIPCCGQLEYTKLLLPSLFKYTRAPFELIFLDIGSLDGTAELLAGVAMTAAMRVEIVRSQTDMGINDAIKEALARARGDYLVLLNNDTVVTHGWLEHLLGLANMSPTVGMVGPMSNYCAPPQLIETVPYRVGPKKGVRFTLGGQTVGGESLVDVDAVQTFAKKLEQDNAGKWLEVDRLGGFCLLLKREVLNRVGPYLEPWTDLSLFDTDVLSAKAREKGFTLGVCRDLFVHHFGTRTFAHGSPS